MAKNKNLITNATEVKKVEHFGIQRKIVAHMTTRSWNEIPHVTAIYEPDVTEFSKAFEQLREKRLKEGKGKLTLNTLLLRVIVEGLHAAPHLNSTLEFNPRLVTGTLTQRKDIDVSIPWILPTGEMMTITLPDIENDSIDQIEEKLTTIAEKVKNTNCTEAMYEISFNETLDNFKKGNFSVLGRIVAAKVGKHKVRRIKGKEKSDYYKIPEDKRLTYRDIRQGTLTVSNMGSIHKDFRGHVAMLEIIPPQIFTMGICNTQMRPTSVLQPDGSYTVESRMICPMCLAVDHRAAEYGDLVPFIRKLDEIFANPEVIFNW